MYLHACFAEHMLMAHSCGVLLCCASTMGQSGSLDTFCSVQLLIHQQSLHLLSALLYGRCHGKHQDQHSLHAHKPIRVGHIFPSSGMKASSVICKI